MLNKKFNVTERAKGLGHGVERYCSIRWKKWVNVHTVHVKVGAPCLNPCMGQRLSGSEKKCGFDGS